mgnify:CR=1 FL=1
MSRRRPCSNSTEFTLLHATVCKLDQVQQHFLRMNTLHDASLLSFHNEIKSIIANLENLLRRTGKIETALSNAIKSIQVGDTVYSVNKPYHDGKVTRFSKGREFVFI